MTKLWWQIVAILSVSVSILLSAIVGYGLWAFKGNLAAVAEGQGVCLAGARAYDSIAAAMMVGRLDQISFLLTAGGVLLGVFALIGFWMIRREALDEAARVAADTAREVANQFFDGKNNSGTPGGDKSPPGGHMGGDPPPNPQKPLPIGDVSTAGAEEEKGAPDAKPKRSSRGNPGASKKAARADGGDS